MDYKTFFSYDDICNRGYDLKAEGRLNQGDFLTIDVAIDDFLQEVFNSIYDLIESYKGKKWTRFFFEDMATEIDKELYPNAYSMQETLKWSLIEQAVFIYENGDVMTSGKIEPDKLGYSQKVIRKLWSFDLLG